MPIFVVAKIAVIAASPDEELAYHVGWKLDAFGRDAFWPINRKLRVHYVQRLVKFDGSTKSMMAIMAGMNQDVVIARLLLALFA